MKISPSAIAVFLGLAGKDPVSLWITDAGIKFTQEVNERFIPFDTIVGLRLAQNFLSAKLTINLRDADDLIASWLPKTAALQFQKEYSEKENAYREARLVNEMARKAPEIKVLACQVRLATSGAQYFRYSHCERSIASIKPFSHFLNLNQGRWPDVDGLGSDFGFISSFCSDPESSRRRNNQTFQNGELQRYGSFFDRVEANPLTATQRSAVVSGEDNTLVVAGAGSGKTSVIVAKAGYLVQSEACQPEQILLLAFSRDAMKEIEERLKERIGISVKVATFHSLGLEILSEVEATKPSVCVEATDSLKMRKLLQAILTDLQENEEFAARLRKYFGSYLVPYRSQFDFQSQGEYWEYLQAHEVRSLKGDIVKSMEELEIANFLFFNGIAYEYERRYPFNTATKTKRQYHPDFTVLAPEVYVEHFCLNQSNHTPHFIDEQVYLDGVAWKRNLHVQQKTTLIETFSHEKTDGTLLSKLERNLKAAGVVFNPLSPAQMFQKLDALGVFDRFTDLLATMLMHFKSNLHTVKGLRSRKSEFQDSARIDAFLDIFEAVHAKYEYRLAAAGEVDFNDMIAKATHYIESGNFACSFEYILVDEFQDISVGRARLLKALKQQKPSARLFCVGDDWQAIYRFAGSDIAIMRNFGHEFGHSEVINLDRTFRFNNQINDLSSKFILKNPNQIPKQVTPHSITDATCVWIHWVNNSEEEVLRNILQGVPQESGKKASVLLLGRYKHLEPAYLKKLTAEFPGLKVAFLTIHRSKGLEADVVIILGLAAGRMGFPTEITDDPLLDLVLSKAESFPEAEERRLFYVGVTRAKKMVHLLADPLRPSGFVQELTSEGFLVAVDGQLGSRQYACPLCETGMIVPSPSRTKELYYACNHAPYCKFRPPRCSRCKTGVILKPVDGDLHECTNLNCKNVSEPCLECKQGVLVRRNGPFGAFMGCSQYPQCEFKARISTSARKSTESNLR